MTGLFGDCPTWLDAEVWAAYCDWRASLPKKQRMTSYARALILNELSRLKAEGQNPTECLKQSLINCWLGVFPVKRLGMEPVQASTPATADPYLRQLDEHKAGAVTGEEARKRAQAIKERRVLQ